MAISSRNLLRRNTTGVWHLLGLIITTFGICPFRLNYRLPQNQIEVVEEIPAALANIRESTERIEMRSNHPTG